MRLLYDMDGTLAHFDQEFDRHLNERYAHLVGIPRSKDQKTFNLWEGRTPEEQDAIREIMNYPGFYRHLEPMEGAVEAVLEAEAEGHEIFFVSAPWTTNLTCAQDKYDWIGEHFGDEYRNKLILAKDKTVVSGDILFDDKYPIPHKERADWVQVFVHQLYNADAEGLRIHSWNEWREAVDAVQLLTTTQTWTQHAWNTFETLGVK